MILCQQQNQELKSRKFINACSAKAAAKLSYTFRIEDFRKKLQLKPDQELLLLNAPNHVVQAWAADHYTSVTTDGEVKSAGSFDAVQLFVSKSQELEQLIPNAIAALKPEGMLWIAYPKKSSGVESDITRDKGWGAVATRGYEGVRQISVDETWSSLRFKHQSERKSLLKWEQHIQVLIKQLKQ